MTKLHQPFDGEGQSPWLDNLTRLYLRDGTLSRYLAEGIRGPNPCRCHHPSDQDQLHTRQRLQLGLQSGMHNPEELFVRPSGAG